MNNETTDPVDSLLQFVKSLNEDSLESLVRELEGKPKSFSLYYDRPEAHWEKLSKELTGLSASGSDIHTFYTSRSKVLQTNGRRPTMWSKL
jgi:hypothetical protein